MIRLEPDGVDQLLLGRPRHLALLGRGEQGRRQLAGTGRQRAAGQLAAVAAYLGAPAAGQGSAILR